ncbi:hypothetical protein [Arthrobacter sp. B6]|uniref:hypothetical protein n=1 Tax=Arthrobacter sp. B6 TaxID=1570137 RepID=UPI00082C99A5|nr:hypothetical protein [Arthrobacter sp. B6]
MVSTTDSLAAHDGQFRRLAFLERAGLERIASADSKPILRRLGFPAITTATPFVWTPPGSGDSSAT